jgi:hypothetical protein
MTGPDNLDAAIAWIREQAAKLNYGRASIEVIAYAGKIARIVTSTEISTSAGLPKDTRGEQHVSNER